MKKNRISKIYQDYAEMPYISEDRDLEKFEKDPFSFPYGKVEKKQMIRLEEGILPGDLIMLWRVHFNTFTNESHFPDYFEYRYGVSAKESLKLLIDKKYIYLGSALESVNHLNMRQIKEILKGLKMPVNGKKDDLIERLKKVPEDELETLFHIRQYFITKEGSSILEKYNEIIKKHGEKKL